MRGGVTYLREFGELGITARFLGRVDPDRDSGGVGVPLLSQEHKHRNDRVRQGGGKLTLTLTLPGVAVLGCRSRRETEASCTFDEPSRRPLRELSVAMREFE